MVCGVLRVQLGGRQKEILAVVAWYKVVSDSWKGMPIPRLQLQRPPGAQAGSSAVQDLMYGVVSAAAIRRPVLLQPLVESGPAAVGSNAARGQAGPSQKPKYRESTVIKEPEWLLNPFISQ